MGPVLQFPLSPLNEGEPKLIISHTAAAAAPGGGFTAAPQHPLTLSQHSQIRPCLISLLQCCHVTLSPTAEQCV